jgi:hypothetical protein
MAGRIRGAPRPKPGPRMEVVRVTTSELQVFTILSTAVFGQMVHFYGFRSHECTKDHSACNGCERQWPHKWKGYLHCWQHLQQREVFLELTSTAVEQIEGLIDEEKPLRGVTVSIRKTKGGRYGRYVCAIVSRDHSSANLPEEKDPYPILKFLWNCKNKGGPVHGETVS